jgi:hypothetical protein
MKIFEKFLGNSFLFSKGGREVYTKWGPKPPLLRGAVMRHAGAQVCSCRPSRRRNVPTEFSFGIDW